VEEEPGTEPRLGQGEQDERDRVPVWSEVLIPGDYGTQNAEEDANASAEERVKHGAIGGEAGGDIAADDAVNDAIESGERERLVGGVLTERRKDAEFVEERVGNDGDDNDKKKSGRNGPCASTEATWPGRKDRCCSHTDLLEF